jgi:hypothetical protein
MQIVNKLDPVYTNAQLVDDISGSSVVTPSSPETLDSKGEEIARLVTRGNIGATEFGNGQSDR